METYHLTPAQPTDLPRCMEILRSGRDFQREQGFFQWPDGFPREETVRQDIAHSDGYVLKVGNAIAAYLYLGFDGDPSYPDIQGAWGFDEPYAVIHRISIADAFRGKGLSAKIFDLVEDLLRSRGVFLLRIDTHQDNKRMQHVLCKNGFSCCGTVIQDNGLRLAYEKKLSK